VIYGPPFTSIIEQSAQVYRDFLGEDAVLEHHSGVIIDDDMEELERYQLSAQRWHFPVIVSTTVQLFESLFSRKPSQCRKVHRITNSVIVLDEVQALPTKYLSPIMAMLRGLVEDWGCSVVFCSATQPWYGILNLPEIRDLVPKDKRQRHFEILNKRVDYCYQSQFWDWSNLVTDIRERSLTNALVVVNTKADARKGFEVLSELGNTFHLSTNMYAVHRRQVLAEVRDRLKKRLPVYLVSTQLIEAGVDVDFEAGYRVITGLDSIVQTAGRVNRNGKRNNATLTIFDLKGGGYPSEEEVKDKTKITRYQLKTGESLYSEPICENYFKSFLASPEVDLDEQNIQELRNTLMFEEVDAKFKMIKDNEKLSVVIVIESTPIRLVQTAQDGEKLTQKDWRVLLQYSVDVNPKFAGSYLKEVLPGLRVWQGKYDPNVGICVSN